MEIFWFGSSSFLIKDSTGKRLFLDPFSHNNKFELSSLIPNCITISHYHFDSYLLSKFRDSCTIVASDETVNLDFCTITGFKTYHDNFSGVKRGENIIYKIIIDDISLLHLGDLGHYLDDDLISRIGKVDVLLIPIGGHLTLDASIAIKLTQHINPSIVIPMNYRVNNQPNYLDGPQQYIKSLSIPTFTKENPFLIKKSDCETPPKLFIIDPCFNYS